MELGVEGRRVLPEVAALAHILASGEVVGLALVLEGHLVDEVLETLPALAAGLEEIEHPPGRGHALAERSGIEIDAAGQRAGVVALVGKAIERLDVDAAVHGERGAFSQ